jgi:methionyl-tRNA formyltransferase
MNNPQPPLRVLFAGTPDFSLPPLQMLIDEDVDIVAVLTQPDRRAGRGKQLRASPVKQLALDNDLDVLQPESLRDAEWQRKLAVLKPELMIVVAYGLMIPDQLLEKPRLGCCFRDGGVRHLFSGQSKPGTTKPVYVLCR